MDFSSDMKLESMGNSNTGKDNDEYFSIFRTVEIEIQLAKNSKTISKWLQFSFVFEVQTQRIQLSWQCK